MDKLGKRNIEVLEERELVDYGIQNDESQFRVHICFNARNVYVYPTQEAKNFLEENKESYRCVPAYQPGYKKPTAMGYLVPINDIPFCDEIEMPSEVLWVNEIKEGDTIEAKLDNLCSIKVYVKK